jgi:hypothetical protein
MEIGKVNSYSMPCKGADLERKAPLDESDAGAVRDIVESPGYSETPSGIKHWKGSSSNPALTKGEVYQTPAQKAGTAQVILIVPKYLGFIGKKTGGVDPFGNRLAGTFIKEDGHSKIELRDPRTGTITKLDTQDLSLDVSTSPIISESKPWPSSFRTITMQQRHEILKADGEIDFRTNEKTMEDVEYYIPPAPMGRDMLPVILRDTEKAYEETVIPKGGTPVTSIIEEKDGEKIVKGTLPSRIEGDALVIERPDGTKDSYEMFIPPSHLPGSKKE